MPHELSPGDERTGPAGRISSPPALRSGSRRLRDPRLWLGIVLVASSALLGGRLLAALDDTIEVWRLVHDVAKGAPIERDDLTPASVHFSDATASAAYVLVEGTLPSDARAAHGLAAGELLAQSGLDTSADVVPELPLGVALADAPANLAPGETVSVWAVPERGSGQQVGLIFARTTVLAVSASGSDLGASRSVLVAAPSFDAVDDALRDLADARAVLVRTGG